MTTGRQDLYWKTLMGTDDTVASKKAEHVRDRREARSTEHFYLTGDGIPATGEHRRFEEEVVPNIERIMDHHIRELKDGTIIVVPESDKQLANRKTAHRALHLQRLARGTRKIQF